MKIKNLRKTLFLSLLSLPFLAGCSHSASASCYWIDYGTRFGDYVFGTTVSLSSGVITSANLKATYLPAVWARVNPNEKSDAEIETIKVDGAYLFDGTLGTVYFAKHIQVGTYSFTGTLREELGDSDSAERGDYVCYRDDSLLASDVDSYTTDLTRYLNVQDTGTYKLGGHCQWYFDCVENGQIHALGRAKNATSSNYDVDYTLGFPEGKILMGEASVSTAWKSAADALCTYLTGKKLNYVANVTSPSGDQLSTLKVGSDKTTFIYNPGYAQGVFDDAGWESITGCTTAGFSLSACKAYFKAFNQAFASVEYASMV